MKTKGVRYWKKKAWDAMSRYVRQQAANQDGFVECVTCDVVKPWKQMQGGHFIPGHGNAVMFEPHNVHPQCYTCNITLKGNWVNYYRFIKEKYGVEILEHLLSLKGQTKIYTVADYQEIYELYSGKL